MRDLQFREVMRGVGAPGRPCARNLQQLFVMLLNDAAAAWQLPQRMTSDILRHQLVHLCHLHLRNPRPKS